MSEITLTAWGKVATISFPDELDSLGPAAFGDAFGYETTVSDGGGDNIENPQSIEEFTIERIFAYVSEVMKAYGLKASHAAAMVAAETAVADQLDSITVSISDAS